MKAEFNPDAKFPWTIDEVEAVASVFYERMPKRAERDKWTYAAREAVKYLNARRNACSKALQRDKAISDIYGRARELSRDREKLPEEWPYEKAVKYITDDQTWSRALKKFKQFTLHLHKGDEVKAEEDLRNLRPKIMKCDNVIELRTLFIPFWRHHTRTQNRAAGKKGGRPKKDLKRILTLRI